MIDHGALLKEIRLMRHTDDSKERVEFAEEDSTGAKGGHGFGWGACNILGSFARVVLLAVVVKQIDDIDDGTNVVGAAFVSLDVVRVRVRGDVDA